MIASFGAVPPCTRNQICGLKNAEDFVRLPGSHWAIASRLGRDPAAPGGFSLVDLEQRTAHFLMPDVSGAGMAACSFPPRYPATRWRHCRMGWW